VTCEELLQVPAPPPTETWFLIPQGDVLVTVERLLLEAGVRVPWEQFGGGRNAARFFGTLDRESQVIAGVTPSVGVRNSIDKAFPLGFCAESRVFVCDNRVRRLTRPCIPPTRRGRLRERIGTKPGPGELPSGRKFAWLPPWAGRASPMSTLSPGVSPGGAPGTGRSRTPPVPWPPPDRA
jgi:hypothetical protein